MPRSYSWKELIDQEKIVFALQELTLAGDFASEASVHIIRTAVRTTLASRKDLWLKPWLVDRASKTNWCKIPYDGTNLFGEKLDSAISKVTGTKSGLIPSDRRPKQQKNQVPHRLNLLERYREARSYRPGKEFKHNWRKTQSSKKQNPLTPEINKILSKA